MGNFRGRKLSQKQRAWKFRGEKLLRIHKIWVARASDVREENFHEWTRICEIHESFLPWKFPAIRYFSRYVTMYIVIITKLYYILLFHFVANGVKSHSGLGGNSFVWYFIWLIALVRAGSTWMKWGALLSVVFEAETMMESLVPAPETLGLDLW